MSYRVVALIAVVAFLLISFVNSFSVYLRQERELADTRVAIAEHEAAIAELTDEVERWDDPAYVEAQARDRLGWVMPGETGYRIIGPDGSVIAGEVATIDGGSDTVPLLWYERLWGSVQVADQPAPAPTGAVEPTPAAVPTSEETPQ
jgi:cell division protein FtsB